MIIFVGDEDDQSQLADPNQYQAGVGTNAGQGTKYHLIPENGSAPYMCRTFWPAPANAYKYGDGDGSVCRLTPSQFTVEGAVLTITDLSVVSSFSSTDILNVQYEPKTIY